MNSMIHNIVFFSAYYPPHLGGVENYTQSLCEALLEKGHRVTVVTSALSTRSHGARNSDDLVRIVEVPSISIMGGRFPLICPSLKTTKLFAELRSLNPTDIVINTRYYPLCLLGCSFANKQGIQPLIIDHSSGSLSCDKTFLGRAIRRYEKTATKLILSHQPKFAAVSLGSAKWLKSLGITTSGIVPNSINTSHYREIASNRDWGRELLASQTAFTVVFAGRLIPEKGITKLIKAGRLLAGKKNDFILVIAGDGPLRELVQQTDEPWLKYVGKLSRPDLSSLLDFSDCLCFPSEYPEGLPTVLLEAAAQKNAIIVSDCAGARDVIPDADSGIILDKITPDTIADSIAAVESNRELAALYAANSHKNVRESFSWQDSASALIRLLEQGAETTGVCPQECFSRYSAK